MRISVTHALAALEEQCAEVEAVKQTLAEQLRIRDDLIRDMREANVPYSTLMRLTNMGRDNLIRIAHSGSRTVEIAPTGVSRSGGTND